MTDALPRIRLGLDFRAWRERLLALRDHLDTVTASADSADGLITATVGGRGELRELWLHPRIYRMSDSARLAAEITGTVRAAVAEVRAQVAADFQDILDGREPRS